MQTLFIIVLVVITLVGTFAYFKSEGISNLQPKSTWRTTSTNKFKPSEDDDFLSTLMNSFMHQMLENQQRDIEQREIEQHMMMDMTQQDLQIMDSQNDFWGM